MSSALADRAVAAAVAVATAHGLRVDEPRVVRDLSNVLVHLAPAPVVARVATSTGAARPGGALAWLAREVELAAFLAARRAAVVCPADLLPPGPHVEDGLAITFWPLVEHDGVLRPGPAEAGEALRGLHDALAGYPGALPGLPALFEETESVLARAPLAGRLAMRLLDVLAASREAIEAAALPVRPLHGDAHAGNLLRTPAGLLWTDLEDTLAGPVEWDLACLVASGGRDEALWAYGAGDAGGRLQPFVEARLVQVAAWTAFMAEQHPQLRERARERLERWGDARRPQPAP